MAQTIRCDGCNEQPADLLVTNVHNGEVLAFDLQCSGVWAEGHAAAMKELFPDESPEQDGQAVSGGLEDGHEYPPYPLPPLEDDPVAQRLGIVDTPGEPHPGPEADRPATLPAEGVPGDEAAAGGENDGRLRGHDRGTDAGDRPAADSAGSDRPGPDQRGGRSGAGAGRESERARRARAAGRKPAGRRRATDAGTDEHGSTDDEPVNAGP